MGFQICSICYIEYSNIHIMCPQLGLSNQVPAGNLPQVPEGRNRRDRKGARAVTLGKIIRKGNSRSYFCIVLLFVCFVIVFCNFPGCLHVHNIADICICIYIYTFSLSLLLFFGRGKKTRFSQKNQVSWKSTKITSQTNHHDM